jgi:uncharacterized membrane protein
MRTWILSGANAIALVAEAAAAIIILVGAAQAVWMFFRGVFAGCCESRDMLRSRIKLGHALSLGLEFLIGADILKTAVAPSWTEIGQLAAIIGIRTVLNLFLHRELEHEMVAIRTERGE